MTWLALLCFLGVALAQQGPLTPCGDECMKGILSVNPNANQQSCSDVAVQNAFGNCVVDQQCTDTLVTFHEFILKTRNQFAQLCQGRFSAQSQPSPVTSSVPSPTNSVESTESAALSNGPMMALIMAVMVIMLA
jgi:hypothetical protein